MKILILLSIMAATGLTSCGQAIKPKPDTVETETINSIRNYEYVDAAGERLLIHNSAPKGGLQYADPNGKVHGYVGFWTQIINETANPVELNIEFPRDSFEFPSASGKYIRLLVAPDTMTIDQSALPDFGLDVKSFLDNHLSNPSTLTRTIQPKDSTAFHVLIIAKQDTAAIGSGALRTGFSLKGQDLFYTISAYKMIPQLPLIEKKEIKSGKLDVTGLSLRK